jgi:putative oxidoreductase
MGRTIGSPELARPAGLRWRAGRRGVLLTPLGVTAGIGVMLNAGSVHFPKGFWNNKGGGLEYPLTIATVFAGVALAGPGRFSLDRAIGWQQTGWMWGVVAVVRGLLAGLATVAAPALVGSGAASRRDPRDGAAASPTA